MDDKEKTYYIGDISRDLGLSQRAIRYYEELGLIRPARTNGGFRKYTERDADLIRIVLRFKDLGMSLDGIRSLIIPREGLSGESISHLREQLKARRTEFELKIRRYDEGIKQIDRVLHILSNCATCGGPVEKGVCEKCLMEHGGNVSPLIANMVAHESEQ